MINKERTLQGVYSGKLLQLGILPSGTPQQVTIWDGVLVLGRAKQSPLIRHYRGRYLIGGKWWLEVPQGLTKDHTTIVLYSDTLYNAITFIIRPWLVPGKEPGRRMWRWLTQL